MDIEVVIENKIISSGSSYVPDMKMTPEIQKKIKEGRIIKRDSWGKSYFTLPYIQNLEKNIAKNVVKHVFFDSGMPKIPENNIDIWIDEFEIIETAKCGFKYSLHSEQRAAVKMAVNCHMGVITGGPGTGKTTVINAIRYCENKMFLQYKNREPNIIFTAPTGKAARRITESVGVSAKTIQKQIGANELNDIPSIIVGDIMIVDEISMIDTITMNHLMDAVYPYMKLLLVGDVDQLPSVGFGSILRDLIDSDVVPVTKLEKTFRQAEGSCLAENIDCLRYGLGDLQEGEDFEIYAPENNMAERLVEQMLKTYSEWGVENAVLLTPYRRKGLTCANKMNSLIQEKQNPKAPGVKVEICDMDDNGSPYFYEVDFRVGDPVMQLKNRVDCPLANGDVGKVTHVYSDNSIYVDFGYYQKNYTTNELNELTLAYAMSVHKSQGSEYKCVVSIVLPEHEKLLDRNMVYTAVTRAKKKCILYSDSQTLNTGLMVESGYIRKTFLAEEIQYEKRKMDLLKSIV